MKAVCDRIGLSPNSVELEQLDVIGSLSAMQHLFLVSLYVGSGSDVALNMKIRAMHQMYQSYAEQKHVLDETITLDATKGFVDVLVNYNLMTAVSGHKGNSSKFPDQVNHYSDKVLGSLSLILHAFITLTGVVLVEVSSGDDVEVSSARTNAQD